MYIPQHKLYKVFLIFHDTVVSAWATSVVTSLMLLFISPIMSVNIVIVFLPI